MAPSILSADFSRLGEEVALADPARDWVHCDVMDNHFVPNLTFGPIVISAARKLTAAFLDVHLMIERPERLIPQFAAAGADLVTVHFEAKHDRGLEEVLALVRQSGVRVGLALKPATPFETVLPYLPELDLLLVMTVEPGFGGQSFMKAMLTKIRAAHEHRRHHGYRYLVEVDGGIDPATAPLAREAGAEVFVAGNSIYRAKSPRAALDALRAAVA